MDAGEAGHTPECNLCHPKLIAHLYTHVISPPRFWWDPNAPEPLSGETLAPLKKNQTYTTKAGTGIKMGYKNATSCLVVLGWALGSPKIMVCTNSSEDSLLLVRFRTFRL